MSERLSAERLAEIRQYWRTTSLPYGANAMLHDLFTELDAVTRERDEARKECEDWKRRACKMANGYR